MRIFAKTAFFVDWEVFENIYDLSSYSRTLKIDFLNKYIHVVPKILIKTYNWL